MTVRARTETTECAEIDGVESFEEYAPEPLLKSFLMILKEGERSIGEKVF